MADDGKPEHYSEKFKREIAALAAKVADLEAENESLRKAAGTSMSVAAPGGYPSMPDPTIFAAMFIAANEVRNMGGDSVLGLMQERWAAARQFNEWVRSGEDVKFYEARQAKIQAEAERQERQKRADEEGEKRKKAAAVARSRGEAPADVSLGVVLQ